MTKSIGPDNCHPRLLKEAAEMLSEPLSDIMNKCFSKVVKYPRPEKKEIDYVVHKHRRKM